MKLPKASTIFTSLGLFLIFLLLIFPFQNLKGWIFGQIYSSTGILIVADEIYPSFFGWPGVGIRNVNVTLPLGPSELELASEKLVFRVGLSGLIPPMPAVSLNMLRLKKGGDLYVKVGQGGSRMKAFVEASSLNLEQLLFQGMQEPFGGTLNADADLGIQTDDLSKSTGSWEIHGSKLKSPNYMVEIPGMPFLIPGMSVGDLDVKAAIKNGTVEISSFRFGSADSDLKGTITGDARLGKTYLNTLLNLTLRLTISKRILENPQNTTFLNFLNSYQQSTPGEYAMRWSANISEILALTKALPDQVTQ
jgi:type II secretion system protein N